MTPIDKWGRDHWSTLLYLETCAVDHKGKINSNKMRSDPNLHPGLVKSTSAGTVVDGSKYPTRLNDGTEAHSHDDWSCMDDMETEGLLENVGTGINRIVQLTDKGWMIVGQLRRARAEGTNTTEFTPILESHND